MGSLGQAFAMMVTSLPVCTPPGLYTKTPLPAGITGLAALNSALSALVQTNPGIATVLTAGINDEEVGHGWKVHGGPGNYECGGCLIGQRCRASCCSEPICAR